jgi:hypothetical protein
MINIVIQDPGSGIHRCSWRLAPGGWLLAAGSWRLAIEELGTRSAIQRFGIQGLAIQGFGIRDQ